MIWEEIGKGTRTTYCVDDVVMATKRCGKSGTRVSMFGLVRKSHRKSENFFLKS